MYVNDLLNISHKIRFILFADETTYLISFPPNVDHTGEIDTECCKLSLWFSVNCLVLNISKCNCVHFSLKHHVITFPHVYLNNNTVKRIDNTKFLGCFIDS